MPQCSLVALVADTIWGVC